MMHLRKDAIHADFIGPEGRPGQGAYAACGYKELDSIVDIDFTRVDCPSCLQVYIGWLQGCFTPPAQQESSKDPTKSSGELEEIIDKLAEVADGYGTGPNWQFFVNTAKIEARSWHATQTTKLQAEARLDEHDTTINYHYPAEESADYKRGFKAATGQVEQWSARRGQELKAELAQLEREHKIGEDGE